MIIIIKVILAHLIGDFLLQPSSWVSHKEQFKISSKYFYLHILVHFALLQLLVGQMSFLPYAVTLAAIHGLIDIIKLYRQRPDNRLYWFIGDQFAHAVSIGIIGMLYTNVIFDNEVLGFHFWIILTGIVFLGKPASVLIRTLISKWTPESPEHATHSLQDAGKYIGILERLFIFGFILSGHFEAVGFLLAAKSIFRFGDLKEARDRRLTEYVLIGTLLSFGLAMLAASLIQHAFTIPTLKSLY